MTNEVINNPTARNFKQSMWGFEITHIIGAISVMALSNIFLNFIGGRTFFAWVLGLLTLITLRLMSMGKRPGHLQFLTKWILSPRAYLGRSTRSMKPIKMEGESHEN